MGFYDKSLIAKFLQNTRMNLKIIASTSYFVCFLSFSFTLSSSENTTATKIPYYEIAVIGAGMTGLSLAYHFEKKNFHNYQIFEKENDVGGALQSFSVDGFTFDTSQILHSSDKRYSSFLEEILGFENLSYFERSAFIWFQNRMIPFPFQSNIGYLDKEIAFECFDGFVNRIKDLENPKSYFDWVMKFYGAGFAKHFFIPYNEKLFNLPCQEISHSWTSRFVPSINLRHLFNSLCGVTERETGYCAKFSISKKGIISLANGVQSKLNNKIETQKICKAIDQFKKIISFTDGSCVQYQQLVSTMPLPNLLKLLNPENSFFIEASKKLHANSVVHFNLGIKKEIQSKAQWIYFSEPQYPMFRIGIKSNFSHNLAPEGCSIVYGEISFDPNVTTEDILNIKINESIRLTAEILGFNETDIVARKNIIIPSLYVIFDFWREENVSKIHEQLRSLDIFSIGRFGEWKYSSIQEAFIDGLLTADAFLKNKF